MNNPEEENAVSVNQRYPCHCCHKKAAIYWSEKRRCFICENCLKTFDPAIIAARNDMTLEQLTLC
ncbi:MAG: hypothetical protein ACYCW5_03035 [Thermoleophilia bacterium]